MTAPGNPQPRLRLWPAILIVVLQWLARFGLPLVSEEGSFYGVIAGMAGAVLLLVWWLFFSRAAWTERLIAAAVIVAAVLATPMVLDESISTGAMGGLFLILMAPTLSLAFVGWAAISRRLLVPARYAALLAAVALGTVSWAVARTGGFTSSFDNDLHWRWEPSAEERLVAQAAPDPRPAPAPTIAAAVPAAPAPASAVNDAPKAVAAPAAAAATPAVATRAPEWPGFRGSARDGSVRGTHIATDWTASPPKEIWRKPIGPGWSSFSVNGGVFYTQEQRGESEIVAAYKLSNGEPIWIHRDAVRFWESNGGAGPRGTPTLDGNRVYAFGATGLLNALDAANGAVLWSRNVASETNTPVPIWGFSSSPLVIDGVVIVAATGTLAAYDAATGAPRWTGPRHDGEGYSSPHLVTIDGIAQIVLQSSAGATSVAPANGAVLWEHTWPASPMGGPIVQPALAPDGMLVSQGAVRRLAISRAGDRWTVGEGWTTSGLKPYFNDYVVHEGHAYGFDGSILACIDLADGARKWKGGRYGSGQLVLLPDQDLLLVVSEEGDLALVSATPDGFQGIARVPGIEGKTWNHPVVVGDTLLVRNGEEMAAFRLPRNAAAPTVP